MCGPKYTLIDFETEYELTEDKVKPLEYAEAILVQEAFDELPPPLQVVLNALIYDALESIRQITQWRIK